MDVFSNGPRMKLDSEKILIALLLFTEELSILTPLSFILKKDNVFLNSIEDKRIKITDHFAIIFAFVISAQNQSTHPSRVINANC